LKNNQKLSNQLFCLFIV